MSITDSVANVSTSWTEQSTVAFQYGVLSTITHCVSEVESKLKRGTLSTTSAPTLVQVKNWLKRAKLELMEDRDYTFARKYAYVDLTAGTYRYALPPDYNGGQVKLRDMSNDAFIPIWLPANFDKTYPDPSAETNDVVECATIKNMELWLSPPPSASDRFELEYSRSGAETTADDFSFLPELERFRCCDFALSHSFESLHMFEVADRFRQYWELGLQKAKKADGRRRFAGVRKQVLNVWQENAMVSYQRNKVR